MNVHVKLTLRCTKCAFMWDYLMEVGDWKIRKNLTSNLHKWNDDMACPMCETSSPVTVRTKNDEMCD